MDTVLQSVQERTPSSNGRHSFTASVWNDILRPILTNSPHLAPSDPSGPPAPTELRVANMSFGPGRAVSARLRWSAPADPDVPVHHYKVSWSWTAVGQPPASSPTKRRKTVRGVRPRAQLSESVPSLLAARFYLS